MYEDEFEEFRARANTGGILEMSPSRATARSRAAALSRQRDETRDTCAENNHTDHHQSNPRISPPNSLPASHGSVRDQLHRDMIDKDWDLGEMRPRTRSAPGRPYCRKTALLRPPLFITEEDMSLYRLRQFTVTRKGVVNRGDCIRVRSNPSIASTGSAHSGSDDELRAGSSNVSLTEVPASYRVRVLGDSRIGKTTLITQFTTSEYLGNKGCSFDGEQEQNVSVSVDDEESYVAFLETRAEHFADTTEVCEDDIDGYLLVFSLTNVTSFHSAMKLLYRLRRIEHSDRAVILVANKSDLVRSRHVTDEEGRAAAKQYDCKYTEVSALLNHKVDELLVGILRQIRLKSKQKKKHKCRVGCAKDVMNRFFNIDRIFSKSCENMMVL